MSDLIIDIETIPEQNGGDLSLYIKDVQAPGQYKKAESIAKWLEDNAEKTAESNWLKTSFDGSKGEIACISWALDDGEILNVNRALGDCEKTMIQSFFDQLAESIGVKRENYDLQQPLRWVGHNVIAFDMRFLWLRCVILDINTHGIRIPLNARHGYQDAFDTMIAWKGFGAKAGGSMEAVCNALGIDGKGDISGADVWPYMSGGKHKEVAAYCNGDVDRTRKIFNRMTSVLT